MEQLNRLIKKRTKKLKNKNEYQSLNSVINKIIYIIISLYFLGGLFILPEGNFDLIKDMPKIYTDFLLANGKSNFIEFIDEQFLNYDILFDADSNINDDPNEKEEKPVSLNSFLFQQSNLFYQQTFSLEILFIYKIRATIFYENLYKFIWVNRIFHPPAIQFGFYQIKKKIIF